MTKPDPGPRLPELPPALTLPCPNFPEPINQQVLLGLIFPSCLLPVLPQRHKPLPPKTEEEGQFCAKPLANMHLTLTTNCEMSNNSCLIYEGTEARRLREVTQLASDRNESQTLHSPDSRSTLITSSSTASQDYFKGFLFGPLCLSSSHFKPSCTLKPD